jgi:hypothetical protein
MEPKLVDEAKKRPGKCLASRDVEGPFIDTGSWAREHDPYIYLSVRWVEEVAKDLLGMVPAKEVDERFASLEGQLKEQAEKLAALERFEEAALEYEDARAAVAFVEVEPIPIEPGTKKAALDELNAIREQEVPV